MDTPIGPEWNTRVGFQRGTLPRVVKKVCLCYFEGKESNEFVCPLVSLELSLNRWKNSHDLRFPFFFTTSTSKCFNKFVSRLLLVYHMT
jgi:hypothetical protein